MYRIAERYAFYPPNPPTYEAEVVDVISKKYGHIPYLVFVASGFHNVWIDTWTIIYCHGNAEDLGIVRSWCRHISRGLGVNVIAWDYPGYGYNGTLGKCSESSCYDDMAQVYSWCLQQGIPENRIILWGKSLGSGIAVHQAARLAAKKKSVAGVILQSPFTSAVRVVTNKLSWLPFLDIFNNVSKINVIQAPIILIHGNRDTVIDISHSRELLEKCRRARFIELPGANHNDIENDYADTLLCQLANFIIEVEQYQRSPPDRCQVCSISQPVEFSSICRAESSC